MLNPKIRPVSQCVLPACRQIDIPTPPIVAANVPSARFAKASRPDWFCHGSNVSPSFVRHVCSTDGHPVDTIPEGATTFRATSESFGVPGFVIDDSALGVLAPSLSRLLVQRLDFLRNQRQLAM